MISRSINPYTNEPVAVHEHSSNEKLAQALTKSGWAYKHWKRTSYTYRAELANQLASLLLQKKEMLATLITTEMGKPIVEARAEVEKCAALCTYYAHHAAHFLLDEAAEVSTGRGWVRFEPIGAILGIMPWNFPFWQAFRYIVPALMAGNVALLKHAANTFGCGKQIEALFAEAGFPDGTMQNLVIAADKVEGIIAHPSVQGVTLTGSNAAGASVATMAGKYLKKSVMELGGSDPFIVLKDADLRHAATVAVQSRLINGGQSCIAAKRFIVEKSVFEAFKALMAQELHRYQPGNPMKDSTLLGPLARIDIAEKLYHQTKTSIILGAQAEIQGGQYEAHFAPYLLSQVKQGMPAFDEEMFGPVASLIVATDEQEAISLANQTAYGLASSIWTQDIDRAERLIPQIEAGAVFVNALVKSEPALPFGGVKQSGYGRELSYFGLKEFCNAKAIYIGR